MLFNKKIRLGYYDVTARLIFAIVFFSEVEAEMVFIVAISNHPSGRPLEKVLKWPLTADHQKGKFLVYMNIY